jgi:hypothetical protein
MKLFFICLLLTVVACKTKPFIKQDIEFKKAADNCEHMSTGFKMNSNLNGERYEFQRCLDADFTKAQFSSIRQGDTIVLKFERKNGKQALYDLTIDLDAYPRYNFLTIDDNTFPIIPAGN